MSDPGISSDHAGGSDSVSIVTGIGSRSVTVHVPGRGEVRCTLRGTLWDADAEETSPLAVGDHVDVTLDREEGVIEHIAPRRNRLARPQAGRAGRAERHGKAARVQVLAANIDRLIVVASLDDPPFRPGLVDRFLVAAAAQEIPAVLCLNKVDLGGGVGGQGGAGAAGGATGGGGTSGAGGEMPPGREVAEPYVAFGYRVLATSCTTGEGIAELAALMHDGISLLAGHSGVGKSSLLNAVSPGLQLETGAVTDYHGRGRHTTTRTTLLPLAGGGFVVDSPGIREFGVSGVNEAELARLYPGFGDLPERCKFTDCRHRSEPGCAVRAAVAAGALDAARHETYLRLLQDLQ